MHEILKCTILRYKKALGNIIMNFQISLRSTADDFRSWEMTPRANCPILMSMKNATINITHFQSRNSR